ncbi:MAG: hypothetical protein CMN31_26610 [Sandaracinus sp.]|nr:hypothetical protein [Myxococcales bacterium]MBJ74860.1 hypothetical protein [Sandaracinus sp.]
MFVRTSLPLSLLLTLALGACTGTPEDEPAMRDTYSRPALDEIGDDPPWALRGRYVLGTELEIDVRGGGELSVESTRPEVFAVRPSELEDTVNGSARAVGEAELVLYQNGDEVVRQGVRVAEPDRLRFRAAHFAPTALEVDRPHVVVGGSLDLVVDYFAGDEQLFGSGALVVPEDAPGFVSSLFPNQDWVALAPLEVGEHEVELAVAGATVGSVGFTAVDPIAIESIELVERPVSGDEDGQVVLLVVVGRDAEGRVVEGIRDAELLVDGVSEGRGGALIFTRRTERLEEGSLELGVEARWGGLSSRATVISDGAGPLRF